MPSRPRLALIHATRVAIDPVEKAAKELWPEAETISILEEGLSIDRAVTTELTTELSETIQIALLTAGTDPSFLKSLETLAGFVPWTGAVMKNEPAAMRRPPEKQDGKPARIDGSGRQRHEHAGTDTA